MRKSNQALSLLAMILSMIIACRTAAFPIQTEVQPAKKSISYEDVLGKSLTDQDVLGFLVNHRCSPVDQFHFCKEVGMALWADPEKVVKTVYLYAGNADGFKRYQGELPFGLSFYDPMWRVQEKLKNPNADDSLQQAGLPEEASSPDHIHYWAVYRSLGMTIIYNSPSIDEDAYIYAVLVSR